jgi:hypothetical protein
MPEIPAIAFDSQQRPSSSNVTERIIRAIKNKQFLIPCTLLSFNFSSCDAGTMQYSSSRSEYGSGTFTLTRLTNTKGLECQNINIDPIISFNPSSNTIELGTCVDDIPQSVCTEVGDDRELDSQFVFGSSCTISFPDDIYLPDIDPSVGNVCLLNGISSFLCGTCRITDSNTKSSKNHIKSIGSEIAIDLIGDLLNEKLLEMENHLNSDNHRMSNR